jgi:hypothetical protein
MFGITKKQWGIYAALGLIGAGGGYLYWYFFGCTSGCTIQSSPTRMALFGAAMLMLAYTPKKPTTSTTNQENT